MEHAQESVTSVVDSQSHVLKLLHMHLHIKKRVERGQLKKKRCYISASKSCEVSLYC